MPQLSSPEVPRWIANRILDFFNRAQTVADITGGKIEDDPADGPGRTIGAKLAARILRERNKLPFQRFTEFSQLDDIRGVGNGTVQDLIYTFGTPAAEAFRNSMYEEGVIYRENWPLEYFRTTFDDLESFNKLVSNEETFREWVAKRVGAISKERDLSAGAKDQMVADIEKAYIDTYFNSTPVAGYALALWFYEFDADNWFSWERIQEVTINYFGYHRLYPWEMELRFFRGFENRGIIPPGITPSDLPVVVNWPEQAITLWFSALYD